MKFEIDIDCPEGWKVVDLRQPKRGEHILLMEEGCPIAEQARYDWIRTPVVILERIKKYREPKLPDDFGKECEFSHDGVEWAKSKLEGWLSCYASERLPWSCEKGCFEYCRIEVTDAQPD
jgi:hypothetical protein